MSDKKISQLPASTTPLAGTEVLPIVQSGSTRQVTIDNLTAGKTVPVKYLKSTGDNNNITVANFGSARNGVSIEDVDTTTSPGQLLGPIQWVSYDGSVVGNPRATAFISAVSEDSFGNTSIGLYTGTQTANPALALNVKANKDVVIPTGNLIIGTAGKGIDFSADPNAGGMTSELLADYEEGTFTPTLDGESTSPTVGYATQVGSYTKIGRVVNFYIVIMLSSLSGGSGNVLIRGLPFTAGLSDSPFPAAIEVSGVTFGAGLTSLNYRPLSTQTFGRLNQFGSGAAVTPTTIAQLAATASIRISGSYSV